MLTMLEPGKMQEIAEQIMQTELQIVSLQEIRWKGQGQIKKDRIFGPTQKADGEWRLKTNEELENAIRYENTVRHIKSKKVELVGTCRKNDK